MTKIFLIFDISTRPVKNKIIKDLFWYDYSEPKINDRLKKMKGGKLSFKYDFYNKKTVATVEDLEETTYKVFSNKDYINNWINKEGSKFEVEINDRESDSKGILIDVDRSALDLIEYSLDRYGIRYEVIE